MQPNSWGAVRGSVSLFTAYAPSLKINRTVAVDAEIAPCIQRLAAPFRIYYQRHPTSC